nr:uncharacterized protein LOC101937683 isoform X1 [Chrysemys picta bellii]
MTFPARSALTRLLFCCAERRCVAERSGALEDTGRDLCRSRMRHSTHERTGAVRDRCHFPPFSPLLHACFWIHHQRRDWTLFYRNGKQASLSKQEERCHNRSVMEQLIDIVLCLVKDGRPFRGHNEKADSFERDLFLNLVNMLQKYDPVMAKDVQQSPRNTTYLSNRIQNELIVALHNVVQQKIASSLNGKMVSIIANDTTDCGHHEQMSVVMQYF